MLFSSVPFLFYFLPATLLLYLIAPRKLKNSVLLLSSLVFYGWGERKYLIFMLAAILQGYLFGLLVGKFRGTKKSKLFMIISVVLSLGLLGYCKYADFFITNFNAVTGLSIPLLKIALPIGISFYTFQILSYTVDVYRGEVPSQKNIINFAAYVTMFPQLIAGPIVRYSDVAAQLESRTHTMDKTALGVRRFAIGLSKKILIANVLGELVSAFKSSDEKSVLFAWIYAIAYTLHIYFDFSGYSDMSIGVAAILGFYLPDNFYFPYRSLSVTEFWRRWHISLSFWFRDYVYIPLGGNRKGKVRMYFNNFLTMLVAGLWHGSSWMFVIWGALHGFGLVVHKFFSRQLGISIPRTLAGNSLSWLITYLYICFAWSFFRAKDLGVLGKMYDKVANDFSIDYLVPFFHARPAWTLCIIGVMLSYLFTERQYHRLQARFILLPWVAKLLLFIICLQMVVEVSQESVQPFIYYQF